MRRHRFTVAATVLLSAALTGLAVTPVQAATSSGGYAALGDSYAVGYGASVPYPAILAGGGGVTVIGSPLGYTTGDLLARVGEIPVTAKQVTVTIGGNDVGFAENVAACALGECPVSKIAAAIAKLPASLTRLLAAIEKQAPNARIYVTGYPLLFQPRLKLQERRLTLTCEGFGYVPAKDLAAVDALTVALNAAIGITAKAVDSKSGYDVVYVDVMAAFAGHGVCQGAKSWINHPLTPAGGLNPFALHPNDSGQQAYAAAIKSRGFSS